MGDEMAWEKEEQRCKTIMPTTAYYRYDMLGDDKVDIYY